MTRLIVTMLAAVLLTGCTALGGGREDPIRQFILAPALPAATAPVPGERPVVAVAPTAAQPGYGTPRMAYANAEYQLSYFAENEWADAPARMLEPLIVRALDSAGRVEVLGPGSAATHADLYLDSNLMLFRQEFGASGSAGRVALRVQLASASTGRVLATRTLEAVEQAPSADPRGGVIAINRAVERILAELAALVAEVGAREQPERR